MYSNPIQFFWSKKLIPGFKFIRDRLVTCPPLATLLKHWRSLIKRRTKGKKEQKNEPGYVPLGETLAPHRILLVQEPVTKGSIMDFSTFSQRTQWKSQKVAAVASSQELSELTNTPIFRRVILNWPIFSVFVTFSHSSAIQSQCHSKRWTIAYCVNHSELD